MEQLQAQNSLDVFETPKAFSIRTGLPEKLVRAMVKQGRLAHVKTGKSHVMVHVAAALEDVKQYAQATAEEIAATLPVPLRLVSTPRKTAKPTTDRKYRGRPPDSVRKAKKREGAGKDVMSL